MIIMAYIIIGLTIVLFGAAVTGAMGSEGQGIYLFCGFLTVLLFVLVAIQQIKIIMAG